MFDCLSFDWLGVQVILAPVADFSDDSFEHDHNNVGVGDYGCSDHDYINVDNGMKRMSATRQQSR